MAIYSLLNSNEASKLDLAALPANVIERHGQFYRVSFVGCVFSTYSYYVGDGDSAYYAVVWDEETQTVRGECYGWGGYGIDEVDIDATPEAWEKAKAYTLPRVIQQLTQNYKDDSTDIKSGRQARIVAGRKYPKGVVVTIKFVGESQYGFYARIIFADGSEAFIDQRNIEVENPDQYLPSLAAIEDEAEREWKSWLKCQ